MIVIPDDGWTFRLLPDALSTLGIKPGGLIHVGAHHGEEMPVYRECGFTSVTLVEPDPASGDVIAAQPWYADVSLIRAACTSSGHGAAFHRTAEGVFSGLRANPGQQVVDILAVATLPVSAIQAGHPANVLVIDTQGTELDVLRSADLAPLDLVIVETQPEGPAFHGAYWPDLMEWAAEHRWTPAIQWVRDHGWADTLLIPEAARA